MSRINRTRRIAMLSPIAFAIAFGAYAQESGDAEGHDNHKMSSANATADAAPSTEAFLAANRKMHTAMEVSYTGDADIDFVRAMIPHHEGAIEMARIARDYGDDPDVRKLAEGIITSQQAEVDWMVQWLEKHGNP